VTKSGEVGSADFVESGLPQLRHEVGRLDQICEQNSDRTARPILPHGTKGTTLGDTVKRAASKWETDVHFRTVRSDELVTRSSIAA
jgi:hypothetical protein